MDENKNHSKNFSNYYSHFNCYGDARFGFCHASQEEFSAK